MEASAPQPPSDPTPTPPAPSAGGSSHRGRIIFWVLLVIVAGGILAFALTREQEKTTQDTAAYTLKLPSGFKEAKALDSKFAMTNDEGATVILNTKPAKPTLSIKDAETRLHNLSCDAKPLVTTVNGQKTVTAAAGKPCGLFQTTAMTFGPNYRVTTFCSGKNPAQAVKVCTATLKNLKVK